MLNSESYTVAAPTISMTAEDETSVDFVLNGEYTTSNPSNTVDVLDGSGDYEGEILNEGKPTASIPVRSPSGSSKKPKRFSSFDYEGKAHLITSVNESKGGNAPQSFTVEATITGDAIV